MEADGNNVCIVVADEGVGIPAEDLARITEPFFTTRAENGGTGLGLSVTDRILRSFGGSMTFESTVGRGTTVTVRLPASENSL
jgi:polar amino acid transport system substrate-binding protein